MQRPLFPRSRRAQAAAREGSHGLHGLPATAAVARASAAASAAAVGRRRGRRRPALVAAAVLAVAPLAERALLVEDAAFCWICLLRVREGRRGASERERVCEGRRAHGERRLTGAKHPTRPHTQLLDFFLPENSSTSSTSAAHLTLCVYWCACIGGVLVCVRRSIAAVRCRFLAGGGVVRRTHLFLSPRHQAQDHRVSDRSGRPRDRRRHGGRAERLLLRQGSCWCCCSAAAAAARRARGAAAGRPAATADASCCSCCGRDGPHPRRAHGHRVHRHGVLCAQGLVCGVCCVGAREARARATTQQS